MLCLFFSCTTEKPSNEPPSYSITFFKNDPLSTGSMSNQQIVSGNKANLLPCAYSKPGYIFAGWALSENADTTYSDQAELTMGDENITLYAKWSFSGPYTDNFGLALRDIGPAGGYIFYINPNAATDGWKYLEAAPESTEFSAIAIQSPVAVIGPSAQNYGIGHGKNNTKAHLNWLIANAQTGKAAQVVSDLSYSRNGEIYNDWFLPSAGELLEMCWALHGKKNGSPDNPDVITPLGGFKFHYMYWSSTESSELDQYLVDFSGGNSAIFGKNETLLVRGVRAF